MSSSVEENTSRCESVSSLHEGVDVAETNEQNDEVNDAVKIREQIEAPMVILESIPLSTENDLLPPSSTTPVTTLTNTDENKNEKQRATTTDIQPPSERHISEWDNDEVLEWFQSYGLNELYNSLFAMQKIDGTTLAKIFELKLKNYESYRIDYTNRLPPNQKNLLKDFDRFGQLLDSYFIDKYTHRFDVAFSFPGDIRDRVSRIAEKLCVKINREDGKKRIFYDKYHKAELARPNLDLYLYTIYRYQTRLIVVFMCDEYTRKEWCGLESRAIRSLLKTYQNDRIMLLTVDGKTMDGVFDIDGYMNISEDSDDIVADAIYSRLKALGDPLPSSRPLQTPPRQSTRDNVLSKSIMALRNTFHSISPWYIVVALSSYILGTIIGR
ncbi:unnamed protein product [Rotaria sp. Silwood1]|nr:unnamed protein product [Rotaria sp. Silwood1]